MHPEKIRYDRDYRVRYIILDLLTNGPMMTTKEITRHLNQIGACEYSSWSPETVSRNLRRMRDLGYLYSVPYRFQTRHFLWGIKKPPPKNGGGVK